MTPNPQHVASADARGRIYVAARGGWTCFLRPGHVGAIVAELGEWLTRRGLPRSTAQRLMRAARAGRGARLSRREVAAIDATIQRGAAA